MLSGCEKMGPFCTEAVLGKQRDEVEMREREARGGGRGGGEAMRQKEDEEGTFNGDILELIRFSNLYLAPNKPENVVVCDAIKEFQCIHMWMVCVSRNGAQCPQSIPKGRKGRAACPAGGERDARAGLPDDVTPGGRV